VPVAAIFRAENWETPRRGRDELDDDRLIAWFRPRYGLLHFELFDLDAMRSVGGTNDKPYVITFCYLYGGRFEHKAACYDLKNLGVGGRDRRFWHLRITAERGEEEESSDGARERRPGLHDFH
jgi:hypothetical protein